MHPVGSDVDSKGDGPAARAVSGERKAG